MRSGAAEVEKLTAGHSLTEIHDHKGNADWLLNSESTTKLLSPLLLLAVHGYLFLEAADEAFLFLATSTPFFALYNLIDLLLVNTKQNLFWVLRAPAHIKKL